MSPSASLWPGYSIHRWRTIFVLTVLIWGWLLGLVSAAAWSQIDERQFRADLQAIASQPSRVLGSDGYYRTLDYLQRQIASMAPGVELRRHEFPVMVPVTQSATITLPDGSAQPIYPFWPASVRVNSTPPQGITGRLVYCGSGQPQEIRPAEVFGQIAVVEASARQRWQEVAGFGPRAILILGTADTSHVDLRSHDLLIPVDLPRFYIPAGALNEQLRHNSIQGNATLRAKVVWQRKMVSNLYAYVAPRVQQIAGWNPKMPPPAALMFSVPVESSGLVPDLAPGASQAVQTAAGLALLRDLAKAPLDRPVVVFFSSGDSIQFIGTRNMLMALGESPVKWHDELDELADKSKIASAQLARARQILLSPSKLDIVKDRGLIDRIVKIIETDTALEQDQLFRLRTTPTEQRNADIEQREKDLSQRQVMLSRLKYAFSQIPADLQSTQLSSHAKQYVQRAIERLGGSDTSDGLIQQYAQRRQQLQQRVELYHWLAGKCGRNTDPTERDNSQRPIEMLVALDLSDHGVRVGPAFFGQFLRYSSISDIQDFREWFSQLNRSFEKNEPAARWFEPIHRWIDFEPFTQSRSAQTYAAAPLPLGSELACVWGVPGLSFITLDDLRLFRDTPNDTLQNVNVDAIVPQLRAFRELFWHAWNDPDFHGPLELKRNRNYITGQVVSPSLGRPVPDLPRQGFLATYYYVTGVSRKIPQLRVVPWTLGIRRDEVRDCDDEGNYRFEGLPRIEAAYARDYIYLAVETFRLEPDSGEITSCTDLGKQTGDIKFYADLRQELNPIRSLVFNCSEFTLSNLYDPRYLQALGDVVILDARRNAEPQRYNVLIHDQLMGGFVEPGSRTYLALRYGRIGNRLLLLNMPDPAASARLARLDPTRRRDGLGFTVEQLNSLGPLALVTSKDFWRLDERRMQEYRKAGVSSALLDELHRRCREQIDRADAAREADDGAELIREANGAWANEARVYQAVQDMARDVVRAAIFLLLLCVPFAFCMERLLIGTPNVYKQIAGMCVIFGIMTAALWSFHPAFKISASPLIIILSFAIIFMSIVVISVIYGKFDTELKRLRSGKGGATAESTSFARASVLMSAVLLGIANMRKRRFRTALTSITIVLITFAVLCFTSAATYLDTTRLPTGVASSYPGVMLRQRGFRAMPPMLMQSLRPVVRSIVGDRQIVERWWNVRSADPREMVDLVNLSSDGPARVTAVQAALGLSPGENRISKIGQVIGASFDQLEQGQTDIVYMSRATADEIKAKVGDDVSVGGVRLKLAGVYSTQQFDNEVAMLSGEPLAPLRYTSGMLDANGRRLDDSAVDANAPEQLELGAGSAASELGGSYEHLSGSQFVIVPAAVSQMLQNATLRSVAIRLDNQAQVKKLSDELAKRYSLALFAGYDDGVRMVTASNLASVSGAGQVAIPLAIAGLIIFNTMMGSIAERRREIHVYTSLGLAPLHVGALFLAEAMTYGLIGTVFGYIIGQGAGTAMLQLGWLGNVTLNYSGTSAILTMGLILLIVLLSALVPARLASKLAAPSIDRTWKVPLPKDDLITADLPFTINKTAADGAIAYLADFFDAHQEGSIGKFSAGKIDTFTQEESRGVKTTIWLTPFDLGVRQDLTLLIHPGQFPDIYEVQVILHRLSGDDGSWYRMNRTFLTELRKQFLQWRSLTPQKMLEYVEQSRALFSPQRNTGFQPVAS